MNTFSSLPNPTRNLTRSLRMSAWVWWEDWRVKLHEIQWLLLQRISHGVRLQLWQAIVRCWVWLYRRGLLLLLVFPTEAPLLIESGFGFEDGGCKKDPSYLWVRFIKFRIFSSMWDNSGNLLSPLRSNSIFTSTNFSDLEGTEHSL